MNMRINRDESSSLNLESYEESNKNINNDNRKKNLEHPLNP